MTEPGPVILVIAAVVTVLLHRPGGRLRLLGMVLVFFCWLSFPVGQALAARR